MRFTRFIRGFVSLAGLVGFALFMNSCQMSGFLTGKLVGHCKDDGNRLQARDIQKPTGTSECDKRILQLKSSQGTGALEDTGNEDESNDVNASRAEDTVKIGKRKKWAGKPFVVSGLPDKHLKEIRKSIYLIKPSSKEIAARTKEAKRVYDQRRRRLVQSCDGKRGHVWDLKMQLIAAPDVDFTVCVVQKAGSSSWHQLVYRIREPNGNWSGKGHLDNKHHGEKLPTTVKHRLMWSKNGTRVLTVRHPFARLVSGWNNKFHKNHLMHSTSIFKYLPGIEDYVGRHKVDDDHVIAFEDFAQYVADYGQDNIDHHFRSVEKHCHPCSFPYDYIVKAETSLRYSWFVLDRVNATMKNYSKHTATGSGVDEVEAEPAVTWDAERKVMAAFYKKVPVPTVQKLLDMYAIDFNRFGYTFDIETMMAGDIVE